MTARKKRPRTKIAKILREQGRKQTWLADVTGYSRTQISAFVNGYSPVNPRFAKLAAQALGVGEEAIA